MYFVLSSPKKSLCFLKFPQYFTYTVQIVHQKNCQKYAFLGKLSAKFGGHRKVLRHNIFPFLSEIREKKVYIIQFVIWYWESKYKHFRLCTKHLKKKESRFNISNPNPTFIFGLEFVRKIGFTFYMNIKIQHLPLGGNIFSQKEWNISKNIFPRIRFKILDKRYANNFQRIFSEN